MRNGNEKEDMKNRHTGVASVILLCRAGTVQAQ